VVGIITTKLKNVNNVEPKTGVAITEKWRCLCSVLITFLVHVYGTKHWPVQQARKRTKRSTCAHAHTHTHEKRGTSETLINKRYPMGEAFIICLYKSGDSKLYLLSSYFFGIRPLRTPYRATSTTYPAPMLCGSNRTCSCRRCTQIPQTL
jgi:hypothetical protein